MGAGQWRGDLPVRLGWSSRSPWPGMDTFLETILPPAPCSSQKLGQILFLQELGGRGRPSAPSPESDDAWWACMNRHSVSNTVSHEFA